MFKELTYLNMKSKYFWDTGYEHYVTIKLKALLTEYINQVLFRYVNWKCLTFILSILQLFVELSMVLLNRFGYQFVASIR
jgi:hypothetical protein